MSSVINTNISSLDAQKNLSATQSSLQTSLQRLSSGLRINSAKDDAAGLAISERFTSQINGLDQAARNANDGISLAQTAEGDLTQISSNLQRLRTIAVQSANATNSSSDRAALNTEAQSILSEVDRVASNSSFNGVKLLDGSFNQQTFQVGANATSNDQITVSNFASARVSALGAFNGVSASNQSVGSSGNLTISTGGTNPVSYTSAASVNGDAKDVTAAINASGIAGLSATANVNNAVGSNASGGTVTASGNTTLNVNGLAITVATVAGNNTQNQANALAAINAQSASTGVVATDNGSGLTLAAADGRNITFSVGTAATGADAGTYGLGGSGVAATNKGTYNVNYQAASGVSGTLAIGGPASTSQTIGQTGTALSKIDITSASGASAALSSIDAALSSVNSSRAQLGAIQNRFDSVVKSLQTTSENLSSSRSRIQDADFASETANLTRNQILSQAGTAMLAQANSLPNSVLSLLKG